MSSEMLKAAPSTKGESWRNAEGAINLIFIVPFSTPHEFDILHSATPSLLCGKLGLFGHKWVPEKKLGTLSFWYYAIQEMDL